MSSERLNLTFLEQPEIEGLTPDAVSDVYDITQKWGLVSVEYQIRTRRFRSGDLGLGYELITSSPEEILDPDRAILFVAKSTVPAGGVAFIRTEQGIVMWHKQLTSEEAANAVSVIDQKAQVAGLVTETGERRPFSPKIPVSIPGKYKVDEVFKEGGAFLVLPGQDPEAALNQFDRPDQLTIQEMPEGGGFTIIRKDQLSTLERRAQIVREVLLERGVDINDQEAMLKLIPEITQIREEIERRLQQGQ